MSDPVTPEIDDEAEEVRRGRDLRILEALIFAADRPLDDETLATQLPEGADVAVLLADLGEMYRHRGVNLVKVAGGWIFRTAPDLATHLTVHRTVRRRLSRAALETLAIIAYHQPITRAEIEEIRGVSLSRGTLDLLLEAEWIQPRGRRQSPGRPATWVTTRTFMEHFGLASLDDLPGVDELKAAGLLDGRQRLGEKALDEADAGQGELSLDEDDAFSSEEDGEDAEEESEPAPQAEAAEELPPRRVAAAPGAR